MKRGGIGLGLAEPELKVQYIVGGGPAADAKCFDVGDRLVAVDGTDVEGMRLKVCGCVLACLRCDARG